MHDEHDHAHDHDHDHAGHQHYEHPNPWTARRILTELSDATLRRQILTAFWKQGDQNARHLATAHLGRALRFREETIRKAPAEKRADWLATRMNDPQFEEFLEMALMLHHTGSRREVLGAFLDKWGIPHNEGSIEVDDYNAPSSAQVREAVEALPQFDRRDVTIYLATAGLLMGEDWAAAAWPVVDEMVQG